MNKSTALTQDESTPRAMISAGRENPDNESSLAFKGLLALTFVIYISPQALFPVLEPLHLALVSAVLGIGSYLLYVFMNRKRLTVMNTEVKLIFCIFMLAVISIPIGKWPGGSFQFLIDQYYKSILLFLMVANLLTSEKRFRQLLWAISIFSAINGAMGVKQYVNGEFLLGTNNRILGGNSGITANPNDLALTLNLALPFVWHLYKSSKSTIQKLTAVGIMSLSVIVIVITFSRGGFLTLVGLILWMGLIKFKEHGARVVLVSMLCFVGFMFITPEGYITRIISSVDSEQDKTGSADARWSSMVAAAQTALEHPFGSGLNMNGVAIESRGFNVVHNVYLEIAVDLGLLAAFLFVWLLWRLVARMRQIRLSSKEKHMSSLAEAAEGSLVAFAVAAMFHPASYHFYFYYLAGIAVALNEMSRSFTIQKAE